MSDREVSDQPTTRILESDIEGMTHGQLVSEISLLNIELDKITKERDDVKKELEVSLLRVSELEAKQKRLIERLDKIESLILKEFGEPEG